MTSMIQLIRNENMKIYRRLRSWIMIVLLPLLVIAGCILDTFYADDNGEWKEVERSVLEMNRELLAESGMKDAERTALEKQIAISEYRLEHDIPHFEDASLWGVVSKSASFIALITVFTAIIAADSVASEFSWGTIKLLLIRPASRTQILLSKYASVMQYALLTLVGLFVFSILAGGAFFGFEGAKVPQLVYKDGGVQEMSTALYQLQSYGFKSIDLVMIVSFAFMISSVFRSSAMAISLSLVMLFVGDIVTMLFAEHGWVKFLLFANTDLTQYVNGTPITEGMTLGFSIGMLVLYFLAFNLSSWLAFNRRDIANG